MTMERRMLFYLLLSFGISNALPNIVQFDNLTQKEWSTAEMECKAEGIPRPRLSIRKDNSDQDLRNGQDERIVLEEVEEGELSILRVRITNLKRSDDGLYFCKASNAAGVAEKAGHIEVQSEPGQVTQIVFDRVTPTTLSFRFMGPENTGRLPITHYVVKYRKESDPEEAVALVEWAKDTPYILIGLKPRGMYHFSVAARNVVGVGPWKNATYIMPEEMVPEPPTITHFPDRFELRWKVPDDNGEPITQFKVRYFRVEKREGWVQKGKAIERVIRSWERNPSYELVGLHPDTYYKIEIRATNKIGNSLPESIVVRTRANKDYE